MIGLFLASWLTTQTWDWPPVVADPTHDAPLGYRIYWQLGTPAHWCVSNFVQFDTTICDSVSCQGDIPEPAAGPGDIVYINVEPFNAAGEPAWDHGAKDGACP